MSSMTNKDRREKWKLLIEEQEKSNLSQEEFCKSHNLSSSSFVYYRGIFRGNQQLNKSESAFTPVTIAKPTTLHEIRLISSRRASKSLLGYFCHANYR